jgi:peroxiredoxin
MAGEDFFLNRLLRYLPIAFIAALPLFGGAPPAVGEKAPDFTLTNVQGNQLRLSELYAKGPVALVVLRGFPGYQCPFCQRQVQEFIQQAEGFNAAGVQVVFVYPGPQDSLDAKAKEFLSNKALPETFHMLLDPGYTFTNLYGLRWDAARETAYPSTFLIEPNGTVFYSQIAKLHGGRTSAATMAGYFKSLRPKK